MATILQQEFFDRPTRAVARELLGKYLVRTVRGKMYASMITETEAYDGFKDLASHARAGKTKRNAPMFDQAGTIYVYCTYGMHWMLNIVCGERDYPAAVLIRGLWRKNGALLNGPAKLTKALAIDKRLNGKKLGQNVGLWIEDRGVTIPSQLVRKTPRIGVSYAGVYTIKPWRFVFTHDDTRDTPRKPTAR